MKLLELFNESFDSNVPRTLIKNDDARLYYKATIGDRQIDFRAALYDVVDSKSIWEIIFSEKSPEFGLSYGKTGSGNEMQVFAFVFDCVKDLIADHHPDVIQFSADKADVNRSKLYFRMCQRFKQFGYTLDNVDSNPHEDVFRLLRIASYDK